MVAAYRWGWFLLCGKAMAAIAVLRLRSVAKRPHCAQDDTSISTRSERSWRLICVAVLLCGARLRALLAGTAQAIEFERRIDEGNVRQCLREVAELPLALGSRILRPAIQHRWTGFSRRSKSWRASSTRPSIFSALTIQKLQARNTPSPAGRPSLWCSRCDSAAPGRPASSAFSMASMVRLAHARIVPRQKANLRDQ